MNDTTQETTQEKETNKINHETTSDKILQIIIQNPKITRREISQNINISEDGVKYHLTKLKEKGKIKHIGSTKSGK